MHVFEPSRRVLWTVVGKGSEHWVDPDSGYCSCPGFYFGRARGKNECYHLESVRLARSKNRVERVVFADEEFAPFVCGLVEDL
ncbi:MAG: hypothetical protein EB829_02870 [Nitrosopumilus sp. H8]|nr:MAG: hypothetical protein EB830_02360 [Nitrosopumilus sp. H13]RNJ79143.1 MAG: hypothetical protein EB829_02870 [Nitrosopumilus sp. H8]